MKRELFSGFLVILLLTSVLGLAFNTRPVKAEGGTIYIRADGSIDPPTAPIYNVDNVTYTFTDNINDSIIVEKDNIAVDGASFIIQGTEATGSVGIDLSNRNNVTIKNTNIKSFNHGIVLDSSSYNSMAGNHITNNGKGIILWGSSYNSVVDNDITINQAHGILLHSSSNNNIAGNNITNNWGYAGIWLEFSSNNNSIVGNNITNNSGSIWLASSSYNSIVGNNITNNNIGMWLFYYSNYNNIAGNNITNNQCGFILESSSGNSIAANNITNNSEGGVFLIDSSNNTLRDDHVSDNQYNFWVEGSELSYFVNDVDSSNTVDGKPVCYWVNRHEEVVPDDAGYVAVVNSTGITVKNLNLKNNLQGILLAYTKNSTISGNNITNNGIGVHLLSSSNNTVAGNNITANYNGISLDSSSSNSIYVNNVINNAFNVDSIGSSNIWNSPQPITYMYNGSEYVNYLGNYWSDYLGIDADNDGIGDVSYSINSENDYYPLMQPFETYFQVPSTAELIMEEITSRTQALTETIISQSATLNASVTGDFNAVLNFTNLEIVLINSGSFAGKGFSKGNWSTNIEGNPYEGSWQGVLFKRPEERKIYLKGMVSGGLKGIVEGFLSESVNGSDIYDQYQATWTINHIGANIVFAKLNLNGTVNYQESVEYSPELYALQTLIQGEASGYYDGSLSVVLTHVRIDNETNPYYGQGFSIISYIGEFGSGEGWTYDKITSPNIVEMNGLFTDPLMGIISGKLDESGPSRTLSITIERIILGLPPAADLKVIVWGPERVSPGQTINYAIEYRNDGLKAADEVIVFNILDPSVKYLAASPGIVYDEFYHEVARNLGQIPAKTIGYLSVKVEVAWGLPLGTTLTSSAYIVEIPGTEAQSQSIEASDNSRIYPTGKILYINGVDCTKGSIGEMVSTAFIGCKSHILGKVGEWEPVYRLGHIEDDEDVNRATPGFDIESDPPVEPTDNNGLTKPKIINGCYDVVYAYSGGTRTAVTAIRYYHLRCETLVLMSPIKGVIGGMEQYKNELKEILDKGYVRKIVIYQSEKDKIPAEGAQAKFDSTDQPWLDEINSNGTRIEVIRATNRRGRGIQHGEFPLYVLNEQLDRLEQQSSTAPSTVAVARDPNIKYGPEGYVSAGQKLDYKVEYENEGEGIAFGVYFTDTLDEDLNETTLEIGPVYSTKNDSVIAAPGTYDPSTRTITWFVGEVGPSEGGYANFSAQVKNDALEYTEIINYATVYFPSVPETTRTNAIVSVVGQPNIAVTNVTSSEFVIEKGSTQAIDVTVANKGYFPETFNLTLYANTTDIQTQNITLLGKNTNIVTFSWNTTGFAYGNYTISAYAEPALNETYVADNNLACIVPVHIGVPGDVSGPTVGVYDGTTNMRDINYLILLFNTNPSSPNWKPNADINNDATVNMRDIQIAILNFNKHE